MPLLSSFASRIRKTLLGEPRRQRRCARRMFREPLERRELMTIETTIGVGGGNDGKEGPLTGGGWPGLIGFGRDADDIHFRTQREITSRFAS